MKLPTNWKQVTIKQYLDLDMILRDTTLEPIERSMQMLAALTGESLEYFESIPIKQLKTYIRQIAFLNDISTIKTKVPVAFRLKRKVYNVSWQVSSLTGGQYIDLNVFTKDKDAIVANMHNIMAVLCLPRKWGLFKTKYQGTEHKARAQLFYENLSMAVAYPLAVFFCALSQRLMPHIVLYLQQAERNLMTKIENDQSQTDTTSNGAGS